MSLRRISLFIVVLTGALAASGCVFPVQESNDDGGIEGTYYMNGVDPDGIEYGGQMIVTRERNDDYTIDWIITGSIQRGVGEFDGRVLEVEWETVEGLNRSNGTGSYELQPDGSLIGERNVEGVQGTATEEAFPVTLK